MVAERYQIFFFSMSYANVFFLPLESVLERGGAHGLFSRADTHKCKENRLESEFERGDAT